MENKYMTILLVSNEIVTKTYREEGLRGLYQGIGIATVEYF